MKHFFSLFFIILLSLNLQSQDTFSICVVDTITGEVGSAGASCIDENGIPGGVIVLSDVHPGTGVIHTQAYWNPANQNYAKQLMNDGLSPQQIIDSLVANDVQNNPTIRQYGIVDFRNNTARSAAYTGINCDDYKSHITGPNYSIQGNILMGQQILDSMESRYLNSEGSLVCRLMSALQGAKVIGADTRCFSNGTSSLSAFVRVAKANDPADSLSFEFNVPSVNPGVDPIDSLQVLVDQWGGCNTTGLQEHSNNPLIITFPNPAKNVVTFNFVREYQPQDNKIIIFDSQGRVTDQISNINTRVVSWKTQNFPKGIYFYKLFNKGGLVGNGKIIVE